MPTHGCHCVTADSAAITAAILRQVTAAGPDKSICPSEVARAMAVEWRPLMGPVRQAAIGLAQAGRIDILRKGRPVAGGDVRGVIRLRVAMDQPATPPATEDDDARPG